MSEVRYQVLEIMEKSIYSFRDLKIWQRSIDLCVELYRETSKFPDTERFGLVSQIRRSAVSVPSNIAEGQQRNSIKEYINFLSVSSGSIAELETQLIISSKLGFFENEKIFQEITEIEKMIKTLQKSLSSKIGVVKEFKSQKKLTSNT